MPKSHFKSTKLLLLTGCFTTEEGEESSSEALYYNLHEDFGTLMIQ